MQLTFIRLSSAQQQPEPGLSEFGVLVVDIKWAASHSRNVIFNLIIYACNHATLVLAKEILKWESSGIWVEEFESSRVSWIYESYTIYKSSFGRSMKTLSYVWHQSKCVQQCLIHSNYVSFERPHNELRSEGAWLWKLWDMIPTQENEKILKHISIKMFLNLWLVGILEHWVTTKTKKKKHKQKMGTIFERHLICINLRPMSLKLQCCSLITKKDKYCFLLYILT